MAMMPMEVVKNQVSSIAKLDKEILLERYSMKNEFPTLENFLEKNSPDVLNTSKPLSTYCAFDLSQYFETFKALTAKNKTEFSNTFIEILDSTGKPGPGILRGHKNMYGLYHQCVNINYDFGNHKFTGNYITLFFALGNATANPGLCAPTASTSLSIDLCLPDSCGTQDLEIFLPVLANPSYCSFTDIRTQDRGSVAGTYITTVIMCFCFALGITASIYDYYILPLHKDRPYTKSFPMKAWRAFSLYTNIVEIFNTKGSNKPGNIGPLHCMRFFSMMWVISGHAIGFFMAFAENPLDVLDITYDWGTQIVVSAYFAVDTFFWQGGLLLSYIWFKKYNQNKKQSMSAFNWVMFYVHRIVRLSPPYYILIAFYTWIFTRKWTSGMVPYNHGPLDTYCDNNWWIDFVYLNNFIHYDKQCYLVSWYLSTDLQMYIFAPLILIPFTFGPLFGVLVSAVIFAISTIVNIWTVVYHHFPPTDYSYAKMDPRMTVQYAFYTEIIYNAPWIRCQIYIIGMVTGYFLQNVKKLRIPWWINVIGWIVTAGCAYGAIWSLQDWISGKGIDIGYAALYSAVSKVGWGIGLSWIVIACYYGYGGFINSFMSWSIWVPLGRLTYSAYLIHICILIFMNGINQRGFVFTNFTQMTAQFVLPIIVLSYLGAIIWSSAFEFAFGKLEDAIIGVVFGTGSRRPPQNQSKPPEPVPRTTIEDFEKSTTQNEINGDSLRKRNGITVIESDSINAVGMAKNQEIPDEKF